MPTAGFPQAPFFCTKAVLFPTAHGTGPTPRHGPGASGRHPTLCCFRALATHTHSPSKPPPTSGLPFCPSPEGCPPQSHCETLSCFSPFWSAVAFPDSLPQTAPSRSLCPPLQGFPLHRREWCFTRVLTGLLFPIPVEHELPEGYCWPGSRARGEGRSGSSHLSFRLVPRTKFFPCPPGACVTLLPCPELPDLSSQKYLPVCTCTSQGSPEVYVKDG